MQWHKITISARLGGKLQDEFEALFLSLKAPQDMALLGENDDVTVYYISSGSINYAEHLIDKYSGIPCKRPKPKTLVPLVINEAWPEKDLLFKILGE